MAVWIRGGEVVDPRKGTVKPQDILVERGRIGRIVPGGQLQESGAKLRIIDASGKIVVPGLIDMHVHLREPGYEYKETIASGSRAGCGGRFHGVGLHAQYFSRQ